MERQAMTSMLTTVTHCAQDRAQHSQVSVM